MTKSSSPSLSPSTNPKPKTWNPRVTVEVNPSQDSILLPELRRRYAAIKAEQAKPPAEPEAPQLEVVR